MKKLSHVFRRRKLLLICLIASMVFSLAKVSVPVSSSPSPGTRVYVNMFPEGYVNGTELRVGQIFEVDVYVENATDLVQWALYVQVDPAVLEVMGAKDGVGTVIRDYVNNISWTEGDIFGVGGVNKTEGKINDISHVINAWDELYPAGHTGFNGSGKLCELGFRVKSNTTYSLIHLYNVELFDGLYWYVPELHPFPPDIVEDGHFNPPPGGNAAVINVVPSESQGYPTWTTHGIDINVTVVNYGTVTINCTVAVYYGSSTWYEIGTQNVTLAEGESTTLTFNWNLSGVAYGVYTIKANATLIDLEDTYLYNNEVIIYDAVKVKIVGDVNGNNYVGSWDLVRDLIPAYGSDPGDPNWNRQVDFDDDAYVGSHDLGLFGAFYGESI